MLVSVTTALPIPSVEEGSGRPLLHVSVLWMNYGACFEVTFVVIEKLERSFKSI